MKPTDSSCKKFQCIIKTSFDKAVFEKKAVTTKNLKSGWVERLQGQDGGTDSEDAEPLERPEEVLERVETVDMRRRVEDKM